MLGSGELGRRATEVSGSLMGSPGGWDMPWSCLELRCTVRTLSPTSHVAVPQEGVWPWEVAEDNSRRTCCEPPEANS